MSTWAQDHGGKFQPALEVDGPSAQNRLTVLLRILLSIPQYIVLYVLQIAASVVVIIGWFAALVLGRLPEWVAEFLSLYLSYYTRVMAYTMLVVDHYPPFAFNAPEYSVRLYLRPGRLNRLTVLFRIILLIPAAIVTMVITYGWIVCSFVLWLIVLVAGRAPRPVFDATAAVLRYAARYTAYSLLLTDGYPRGLFGDRATEGVSGAYPQETAGAYPYPPATEQPGPTAPSPAWGPRPLVLSSGGRVLLIVFIVVGVGLFVAGGITSAVAPPAQQTTIQATT